MAPAHITLQRKTSNDACTIGRLHIGDEAVWTLEDAYRKHKVYGETRIPAGRYRLELRTRGGMHERYSAAFPNMHRGMIWLRDVPLFEYVYLHIGNDAGDTEGCILVGKTRDGDFIGHSRAAYTEIYNDIVNRIDEPGGCYLSIIDEDHPQEAA